MDRHEVTALGKALGEIEVLKERLAKMEASTIKPIHGMGAMKRQVQEYLAHGDFAGDIRNHVSNQIQRNWRQIFENAGGISAYQEFERNQSAVVAERLDRDLPTIVQNMINTDDARLRPPVTAWLNSRTGRELIRTICSEAMANMFREGASMDDFAALLGNMVTNNYALLEKFDTALRKVLAERAAQPLPEAPPAPPAARPRARA